MALQDVPCPFCGLVCDDLEIEVDDGRLEVRANGCELSRRRFSQASHSPDSPRPVCRVAGADASLQSALARAAEILSQARLPLIAGLATDVAGARAAVTLAQRCDGVIDHAHGEALARELGITQREDCVMTTLTEARNRADLMVIAGERIFELSPRLVERVIGPRPGARADPQAPRELVLIGPWERARLEPALAALEPTLVTVDAADLRPVVATLQALVGGATLQAERVAGISTRTLRTLATRLERAHYATVMWSSEELTGSRGELTIHALMGLVAELNTATRAGGLALGGADGATSLHQVCTSHTGLPPRLAFMQGQARYEPYRYNYRRVLAEADALLWVCGMSPDAPPPRSEAPTVLLGHPALPLARAPEVYIPIGVPGIDHAGHLYRADSVATLPLRRLREAWAPSAAEMLGAIAARLPSPASPDAAHRQ